jgi:hypothetical protein
VAPFLLTIGFDIMDQSAPSFARALFGFFASVSLTTALMVALAA